MKADFSYVLNIRGRLHGCIQKEVPEDYAELPPERREDIQENVQEEIESDIDDAFASIGLGEADYAVTIQRVAPRVCKRCNSYGYYGGACQEGIEDKPIIMLGNLEIRECHACEMRTVLRLESVLAKILVDPAKAKLPFMFYLPQNPPKALAVKKKKPTRTVVEEIEPVEEEE